MLRKIRIVSALIFFVSITLLFLDFTGTTHHWLGWMAKIQFLPALLSLNILVILGLIILTFIFGRIYCSIICPLGILQDIFAWIGKKQKKNRYTYSKPLSFLRYTMLIILFISWIAGISSLVALFAPYSSYGRIANNLFQPIWIWTNNGLAIIAEHTNSFMFYSVDIWIKSIAIFIIAAITLIIIAILSWRNGRTYCNSVCPVGTILGLLSKYSWFKPVIDTSKCINCGLCAKKCKASCINPKYHSIDYSRCVDCMDCIDSCKKSAISYTHINYSSLKYEATDNSEIRQKQNVTKEDVTNLPDKNKDNSKSPTIDVSKRKFLIVSAILTTAATLKGKEKLVDGGLAVIKEKEIPNRNTPITPPGSLSARNMSDHCTGCQLCVSACPNDVLRPSTNILHLMQPIMSYERGYCRPECTRCSDVCPSGAINPITKAEKFSIQIGHAVWIKKNCVAITDNVECGNCARHCPTGAIQMIPSDKNNLSAPMIPAINTEICIGCGTCENLCPARPFSAIYVEGHENHRII